MRVRGLAQAASVMLILSALVVSLPTAEAALEQHEVLGMIYLCDGTFLGDTPWADGVAFNIQVLHLATNTTRTYETNFTSGGWYSFFLPAQDWGVFWDDGDPYWVFVDGSPWGGLSTTFLSFGNGTVGVGDGNLGELEFTPLGNVSNVINWDGTLPPGNADNRQQWDLIENCADLVPVDVTVDGAPYPVAPGGTGPCWVVGFGATVALTANVTNVGLVAVNDVTNITFYNATTILGESVVPPVAVGANLGPYGASWVAPSSPGTFLIDITVDFPIPGRIVEASEANNTVTVCLLLQGPDLLPWDVTIADPLNTVVYPNDGSDAVLVVSLADPVFFGGWVRNTGWVAAPSDFDLILWNATDGVLSWTTFPSLASNTTSPANVSYALTPPAIGIYDYYILADSAGTFDPTDGNITEVNEDNNTRLIRIIVRGPDLIPANVTVDATVFPDDSSPQFVPATFGQSYWLATWARNVGLDNVTLPFTVVIANETGPKASAVFSPPLAVGATTPTNVSYVWTATFVGSSCFTFTADTDGNVTETVETNNSFQVCFSSGGPDLVPSNVDGNGQAPTVSALVGDTVTLNATATNLGGLTTGVGYRIAFHTAPSPSCDPAQLDQPPFATFDLPALDPGATSSVVTTTWPAANNGTFYISIVVDALDAVVEVAEDNNCFSLTLVVGGFPDLLPENVRVDAATYVAPVDLVAGQTVNVSTQVRNIGLVDSDIFGPSFTVVFLNASDGSEFGNTTFVGSVPAGGVTPGVFWAFWTAPLAPGTYVATVYADRSDDITEDDEGNNAVDLTFEVFDLVAPPSPVISATVTTDTLDWTDDPGPPEVVAYNVYGGTDPTSIDFTTRLNPADITTTSFAFDPPAGEFYYVVRSVDARGWEGPSSEIVGRFAVAFPRDYSTFALPLEPLGAFRAHDLAGGLLVADSDVVFAYDANGQVWVGHARGMPASVSNFDVVLGRGYMVYLADPAIYVFVGRPGTTIRFVDFPGDPRVGASAADAAFRESLQLTALVDGVQLDWEAAQDRRGPLSPFEYPAAYRVYRAASRGGPYGQIAEVTALTFSDPAATAGEFYYLVVPVNAMGREGTSTFAAGILWTPLGQGMNSFGLAFQDAGGTVGDVLAGQDLPGTAVLFAYDASQQRWKGHAAGMPRAVASFPVTHSEGYYITVLHEGLVLVMTGR